MKIIISANVLFTITNFRIELIKFLKENDFEIVCVAEEDNLSSTSIKVLDSLGIKFIKVTLNRKGLNPLKDLIYLFSLYKIYKSEKADYVMHFTIKPNIYGTIAAKFSGVKSINTINGLGSAIIKDSFLSKILKNMYKFSLFFSSKVFFQNSDDLEFFIRNKLVNKEKTGIVPGSGVNVSEFSNCKANNNHLTFLFVGRLLKDKGIYEYIDAIREVRKSNTNIKFLLGGQFDSGNPTAISKDEVKKWEEDSLIEYLGQTDDIKEFLKLADVVVLPSYREGLSRFLIESASASKPIITTNVPGCKDVVNDSINGFLCNAKDRYTLKKAIEQMISLDYIDLKYMGEQSRIIAKSKYDKEIVNNIYLEALF